MLTEWTDGVAAMLEKGTSTQYLIEYRSRTTRFDTLLNDNLRRWFPLDPVSRSSTLTQSAPHLQRVVVVVVVVEDGCKKAEG